MLFTRLYYHLKPLMPQALRLNLRRIIAKQKRQRCGHLWPINPAAATPPQHWVGWPDNKQFVFVIVHDVEGQIGLDKCRQLMELEQSLGFCSSFNFIPEGEYAVSRELREEIIQSGSEVGVHDLHHDGKLYHSRKEFTKHAFRINKYLNEWDAVGFRSAFMLNRLEWLHDLNIAYDSSTFDTDPFEPQPQGQNTIFPFWVPRPGSDRSSVISSQSSDLTSGRSGYVELPYTLAQDSTLFLVLRESTPEVWCRKLKWIAEHGGMAMIGVHPDYISFDDDNLEPFTYSARLYKEFLLWVKDNYKGFYWNCRPKDAADYYLQSLRDTGLKSNMLHARGAN